MAETVHIEKLVHGGQGLATLADGRKVFVWNALPGETVAADIKKGKRSYAEAVATEIITASSERVEPRDAAFLSTSPWQIMNFAAENRFKQEILTESFGREHVTYDKPVAFRAVGSEWHYRNKMEYSFWGDDGGLHLALFNRGSHGKQIIKGSSIARPEIDEVAIRICKLLAAAGIRAGSLKTLMLRTSQRGEVVAALFVKEEAFPKLKLEGLCQGVTVYYSNPKSPASLPTKVLQTEGELTLSDTINGVQISYDAISFFQVNLPVFEAALGTMQTFLERGENIVDMYAGVGTIGLAVGAGTLVEVDPHNIALARANAAGKTGIQIIEASAETALEYVPTDGLLIVDPPRAGLHARVVHRILEAKPQRVLYLSCNPATQARDLARLQSNYVIDLIEGYNFFPRTPHIESLAILSLKG